MTDKKITGGQVQVMIAMFLFGSSFVMSSSSKTNQDIWVTFLLGGLMMLPMIFIYCALIRKYPDENLFEIIILLFGKIAGKIICSLYIWYALHVGSMVLRTFTEFIYLMNMPETPQIAIAASISLIAAFAVISGPENMGRIAKITFPVMAGFIVITVLIAAKNMDFSNIKPVLHTDFKTLLGGSFTVFSLPFGEILLFLTLFPSIKSKEKPAKIFAIGLILAIILLLLAHLRNLLVLGAPNVKMYYFSSYQTVSVISVGEFFTRMEVLIGIIVLLGGFIKIFVFLFTASVGLAATCNIKNYKKAVVPCMLVINLLSKIDFQNTIEVVEWIVYHSIYVLTFQVILPVVMLIIALIKTRKMKPAEVQAELENIGTLE